MGITKSFELYVVEQLSHLGAVSSRRMFGGAGLYIDDVMFGLLAEDLLYLKSDNSNKEDFEKIGLKPFQPFADKKMVMSYHEAPAEVLEDRDFAVKWVGKSIAIAKATKKSKKTNKKKIRNIGPKSMVWLKKVGINSASELKKRGAVKTFLDIRGSGQSVSLNLLYALYGAVENIESRDITAEVKARLRKDVG
ncbi:MAG: TfoX/Sxy family DNA transformation protein [Magnetococcales bacterium]|nr:TfoX/Sxy family DNA transformation protein [Magnetococcales bacterium]